MNTFSESVLFRDCCNMALQRELARVQSAEITDLTYRLFAGRVKKYLLPTWGSTPLEAIDTPAVQTFVDELTATVKRSTVRQILMALRRVFHHASTIKLIDRIPVMPRIKGDSVPRGAFTAREYLHLYQSARAMSAAPDRRVVSHRDRCGGLFSRDIPLHSDLPDLIRFMVNCFIRPTDLKWMQHRHVQVIEGRHRYLRLELPESKRHVTQIVSMRPAVSLYKKILSKARQSDHAAPSDYVFLPEVRDRKVAMMIIDVHFRRLLEEAGLRVGKRGQVRTLYSLRHTSIMFRLLYGRGIDLLTLARNARTSVEMIEKFYASELSAEMNVDLLHSRRSG